VGGKENDWIQELGKRRKKFGECERKREKKVYGGG